MKNISKHYYAAGCYSDGILIQGLLDERDI